MIHLNSANALMHFMGVSEGLHACFRLSLSFGVRWRELHFEGMERGKETNQIDEARRRRRLRRRLRSMQLMTKR